MGALVAVRPVCLVLDHRSNHSDWLDYAETVERTGPIPASFLRVQKSLGKPSKP